MYLKLNRKGHIDTDQQSDNQCKDVGWGRYAYEVGMICYANDTDEKDFIIDNTVVHRAILSCFSGYMSSCEGMVKRVATCLKSKAVEHNINLIDLHIIIKPRGVDEHSYAWFEWSMSGNF